MIYLDMDGVLVDLVAGMRKEYNLPEREILDWELPKTYPGLPNGYLSVLPATFWAALPKTKWCDALINYLYPQTFVLLTHAITRASMIGKVEWVHFHLGSRPIAFSAQKGEHIGECSDVLIDDKDGNIEAWVKAGGIGILWPASYNKNSQYANDPLAYVKEVLK